MIVELAKEYIGVSKNGINGLLDYYNREVFPLVEPSRKYRIKPNDQWCMCFCSVMAHKAGIKRFPWEVSTYYALQLLEARGETFANPHDAKRGDLIFFDWNGSGTPNHVGFVVSVDSDTITTIEGNKGGTVGTRIINPSNQAILAFASVVHTSPNDHLQRSAAELIRIESLAWDVIHGVYGAGDVRRVALGDDYCKVQTMVNKLLKQ